MKADPIRCQAHYWTGSREGQRCRARARWCHLGRLRFCGVHARAFLHLLPSLAPTEPESERPPLLVLPDNPTEDDRVAIYRAALTSGLSDAEAREEGWPTEPEAER